MSFSQLRAALSAAFLERSEAIDAILTATIAGEHTILLGPPGTAKSALARAVAGAWGLSYWETLLTRFSTPEDVFGPVKLSALQQDRYERATANYFPSAEVAFLDECFKANAGILNALLSALNERVFHNGGTPVALPLVSCIGASNELPEGPELDALYDRFLVRLHVDYLSDRDSFLALLQAPEPSIPQTSLNVRAEQCAARKVTVGKDVCEAVADIRTATRAAGLSVSDRRWRKCLALVRANAHIEARKATSVDDLSTLEHALWRDPAERVAVAKLVQQVINPNAARAVECLDAAKEALGKLPQVGKVTNTELLSAAAECNQTIKEILSRLSSLGSGKKIASVVGEVKKMHTEVSQVAARAAGITL